MALKVAKFRVFYCRLTTARSRPVYKRAEPVVYTACSEGSIEES